MPADINCIFSYNKHESDHSVWPTYFVDNLEHQRTSAKKRYRTKPHWKLLLDWKISSLALLSITTGCCYCRSHLSVSLSNQLLHILTQSLVRVALFMIFYGTLVQKTDDAMQFQSVTAYTSIFGYTHRSPHFYFEVCFFFDVIPLMDRFVLFPLETLLIE